MASGCESNDRNDIYKNIGIAGALVTIALLLKNAFKTPKIKPPVTKEEILIGTKTREGLSAIRMASKIIERKKELGIPTTPLESGGVNLDLQMEVARCETIIDEFLTHARVEAAFPPGVPVTATGGNAGGPIVVQGLTTNSVKVDGVVT